MLHGAHSGVLLFSFFGPVSRMRAGGIARTIGFTEDEAGTVATASTVGTLPPARQGPVFLDFSVHGPGLRVFVSATVFRKSSSLNPV